MHLLRLFVVLAAFAGPVFAQEVPVPQVTEETIFGAEEEPAAELEGEPQDAGDVDMAALDDPVAGFEDRDEWQAFAQRAQDAVSAGRVSGAALADLRATLSDWRDLFLARQSLNSARIATVRAQIDALGPVPETGDEDPRVAARRAQLNAQLQDLRAPVTLANEAFTQANGLIAQIDSLTRERQGQRVSERAQSPLNPAGWATALDSFVDAWKSMSGENVTNFTNPNRTAVLRDRLPVILVLLAIAIVFVIRGRAWFARLEHLILSRVGRGQGVVRFVMSLGQIAIPLIGLIALVGAVELSGMAGRRTFAMIEVLPRYGMLAILAHWIAGQLFPYQIEGAPHHFNMTPHHSARARRRLILLGYAMAAFALAARFCEVNDIDGVSGGIVMFPFGFTLAWMLYWFGHIIRPRDSTSQDDQQLTFRDTLRGLLSRGLMIAAVGGVVLAAFGYVNAVEVVTFPAAMTVLVIAVLLLLQRLSVDVYSLATQSESAAQTALAPVLIGFALVLLALPVLALIWGAQVTDLTELWARFREGFTIGETRISPSNFFLFAVVFVVGYTVTRLAQGALRSTVLPRTKLDVGGQNAIVSGLGYVGLFLAALIAITTAGIDLSGLAIVAGALSVGIGFGLQNIVSNFISGIILLIERPISAGDWIEVGGQMGYVRDISVRSTRIETFDRTDVIVPNADLISGTVTNYTRGNSVGRVILKVGVAYGTDTRMIEEILTEIAEAHPMVLLNPPPRIFFMGFGASSLDFEVRVLLRDINQYFVVLTELNHQIARRFAEEGIEIPFAQQDVWLRNPETLRPDPQETS